MRRVLIVEDEENIARVLELYLKKEGFQMCIVDDGEYALDAFERFQPSLVLLDMMLPNVDGWTVLQSIRKISTCPVIILTSLTKTEQKVYGLDIGADDYITKPFDGPEVAARVKAVLRRPRKAEEKDSSCHYGSLEIDFFSHQIFLNGEEIHLSPRDSDLLLTLAGSPKQIFSREQLIDLVWGMDYQGSERAVDLAIKRVRQALGGWNEAQGEIRTMHRVGYQFMIYE